MNADKHLRPAIAMIELIFALVIMGIALMSTPMLMSTASKTTTVALQQEGINEATSRIAMIMTYAWDEKDTNESCATPPVLRVSGGDNALKEVNTTSNPNTGRRVGVPTESSSRTFLCKNQRFDASAIGSDGGDKDDIDDFDATIGLVSINSSSTDYIETTTVNIATSVYYTPDAASSSYTFPHTDAGSITNIKGISVTLTSSSSASELNQKEIKLHGFSCNIGGMEFAKRTF